MQSTEKSVLAVRFFKASLAYFLAVLILGALMIMGFGPQGAKMAHVHVGLIGFVTFVIMGSMYQIVPTLTGTKLFGGSLSEKQFLLINLGMVVLFFTQLFLTGPLRTQFSIVSGIIILFASFLFAYIIFKTLSMKKSKMQVVTIPFFKAAIIYYLAGITMGILMLSFPRYFSQFLLSKTAHAHLGTLGFITMTIFGAEYQMFPMLSLQKLWSDKWAKINFWTFTIGVAGLWFGLMFLNKAILTASGVLLLISTYIFLINMLLTLKGAKWGALDISVKYLVAGHLFLLITTSIGVVMALSYQLDLIGWLKGAGFAGSSFGVYDLIWTHTHFALIGFVTLTISGAMYHLVPMLVWMEKYGPKMGKEKVPNIQDLFSQSVAGLILWSSFIGLIGIFIGRLYGISILLRASALLIAGAGTIFTYAMYKLMWASE